MKQRINWMIHVPQREERDYRDTLVGLKHPLHVDIHGCYCTYDLKYSLKPRRGQEHQIVEYLAEQIVQGLTIVVWDVDRLMRDLQQIVENVTEERAKVRARTTEAWKILSEADDEQLVEMKAFARLPEGHLLSLVMGRENISAYARRVTKRLYRDRPQPPRSEQAWGVIAGLIMTKKDATKAMNSFRRWKENNRPRPPRRDPAGSELSSSVV